MAWMDDRDERRRRAAAGITTGVRTMRALAASGEGGQDGDLSPGSPIPSDMGGIDVRPANAYEAVTRQMVEAVQEDMREIKGRLNALLFAIAGGVAIDVVTRLLSR